MRKLIEKGQKQLIVCDNPECDFEIPHTKEVRSILHNFINMPCPKCGQNILTYEDYITFVKIEKAIDFINKWFSWITIFSPNAKRNNVKVHVHDGIKIKGE